MVGSASQSDKTALEVTLETVERLIDAEDSAWQSYYTRAATVASLSVVGLSVIVGVGQGIFERDLADAIEVILVLLYGLAVFSLLAAVVLAMRTIFHRGGQAPGREELIRELRARATPRGSSESVRELVVDHFFQTLDSDRKLVAGQRSTIRRAYGALVVGAIALSGEALLLAAALLLER